MEGVERGMMRTVGGCRDTVSWWTLTLAGPDVSGSC